MTVMNCRGTSSTTYTTIYRQPDHFNAVTPPATLHVSNYTRLYIRVIGLKICLDHVSTLPQERTEFSVLKMPLDVCITK